MEKNLSPLKKYRQEIDRLDDKIIILFNQRFKIVKKIFLFKQKNKLPLSDPTREQEMMARIIKTSIHPKVIKKIYSSIFIASKKQFSKGR